MRKDPFARTVVALLRCRGERGGWVRIEDLAREVGVSKSTIRRQLDVLQAAGFPIEHHVDRGAPRRLALGVRSLVRGVPVEPDPDPERWVDRDSLRAPPSGLTGERHPWRQAAARDREEARHG